MQGVTLDLWDTIIIDDSDEPLRAERGLPSKRDVRLAAIGDLLRPDHEGISAEAIAGAWDSVHGEFVTMWRQQHVTFDVRDRLGRILEHLEIRSPSEEAIAKAVACIEAAECDPPPQLIEGAAAGVRALADRGPIVLISDTVITPGHGLRRILETHGLLDLFSGCVFSDEAGRSKPHRSVFEQAATLAGLPLDAMAHVGDRQHHDVVGAREAGMRSVLFTASRATDRDISTADAICDSWSELPSVITSLGA